MPQLQWTYELRHGAPPRQRTSLARSTRLGYEAPNAMHPPTTRSCQLTPYCVRVCQQLPMPKCRNAPLREYVSANFVRLTSTAALKHFCPKVLGTNPALRSHGQVQTLFFHDSSWWPQRAYPRRTFHAWQGRGTNLCNLQGSFSPLARL